jgi:hypothetical protein
MIWEGLGFQETVSFLGPEWQITMLAGRLSTCEAATTMPFRNVI